MTREQIAEIGKDHYADMVRLGWIDKELSNSHYLMLIIGEVCEAIQADRKGNLTVSQSVSRDILRSEVDEMDSDLLFKESFEALGLSARGYHRILRCARTIADMDHSDGDEYPDMYHLLKKLQMVIPDNIALQLILRDPL